jgi:hypothetical protein
MLIAKVPGCGREAPLGMVGQVLGPSILELLLLGVALDVLPERAGIGVPLGAAQHLALVRLLQRNTHFKRSKPGANPALYL